MRVNFDDLDQVDQDAGGGNVYHYQGVPFTGIAEIYYPNQQLEAEFEIVDGSENGFCNEYHENGQLEYENFIRFNRYYGDSKLYDDQGNLLLHLSWDEETQDKTVIVDNRNQ